MAGSMYYGRSDMGAKQRNNHIYYRTGSLKTYKRFLKDLNKDVHRVFWGDCVFPKSVLHKGKKPRRHGA